MQQFCLFVVLFVRVFFFCSFCTRVYRTPVRLFVVYSLGLFCSAFCLLGSLCSAFGCFLWLFFLWLFFRLLVLVVGRSVARFVCLSVSVLFGFCLFVRCLGCVYCVRLCVLSICSVLCLVCFSACFVRTCLLVFCLLGLFVW